ATARHLSYGPALVLAACYVPVAILNLPLAIVLWLPLAFIERLPLHGAPTATGLLLLLSWLGALANVRSTQRALLRTHRVVLVLLLATLTWVTVSLAWAHDEHLAWQSLLTWYAAGVMVLLVITTLSSERLLRMAIWATLIGAALSVVSGLFFHVAPPTSGGVGAPTVARFTGSWGDPNLLAAGLVGGMALAAALVLSRRRGAVPILVLVLPIVLGFAASGSRGGMVGAAVALIAGIALSRGHRRQMFAGLAVAAVIAAGWFAANPTLFSRVTSVSDSGTGRITLWTAAARMWEAHPITGVGIGNFPVESRYYVQRPGVLTFVDFTTSVPKVVHNTFLEMLAETGVIGLALYLATVLACLRSTWRAVRLFDRCGRHDLALLARGVLVAALGMLAAVFFLSAETDKRLWLFLALGPVLQTVALRQTAALRGSEGRRAIAARQILNASQGRLRTSAGVQGSQALP
ncbi:MAG: O-antigen ligase family protein, partial [Solirubrobacteraceae bacterium]